MKFLAVLLPLVTAASALGQSQSLLTDKPKVPGQNPLVFCEDPSDFLLQIDFVDLSPMPILPGNNLTIVANGTLSRDVEAGATVFLQVKYGLITLIKQEADLCDNLDKIDQSCPVKKGPVSIVQKVEIPKAVPPGRYTVLADANTKDDEKITCMEAAISFPRPGSGN